MILLADQWWERWAPPLMMLGGVATLALGLVSVWLGGRRVSQVMAALDEVTKVLGQARVLLDLAARTQALVQQQRADATTVADRAVSAVREVVGEVKDAVVGASGHGELRTPVLPPLPPPGGVPP